MLLRRFLFPFRHERPQTLAGAELRNFRHTQLRSTFLEQHPLSAARPNKLPARRSGWRLRRPGGWSREQPCPNLRRKSESRLPAELRPGADRAATGFLLALQRYRQSQRHIENPISIGPRRSHNFPPESVRNNSPAEGTYCGRYELFRV